jgi:urease accessory protein UreE
MTTSATSAVELKKLNEVLVKTTNPPVVTRVCHVFGQQHLLYFVVEAGEVNNVR